MQEWFSKQSPELVFWIIVVGSVVSMLLQLYFAYKVLRACCGWPVDKGWRELEKGRAQRAAGGFYEPSQPYDPTPPLSHPTSLTGPSAVGHVPSIVYLHPASCQSVPTANPYAESDASTFVSTNLTTKGLENEERSSLVLPVAPKSPMIQPHGSFQAPIFDAAFEMNELKRKTTESSISPPPVAVAAQQVAPGEAETGPMIRPTHAKKASTSSFVPKPLSLGKTTAAEDDSAGEALQQHKVDEKPPQLELKELVSDWTLNTFQASVDLGRKMSLRSSNSTSKKATP